MLKNMFNEKLLAILMLIVGLSILYSSVLVNVLIIKLIALLFGAIISIVNGVKLSLLFSAKSEKKKDPVYDRFGASFVLVGATISIGLLLTAFTFQSPKKNLVDKDFPIYEPPKIPVVIEFEPPITDQKKEPLPKLVVPPPPEIPKVIDLVDDKVELTDEPELVTTDIDNINELLNDFPEPAESLGLDDDELKEIIDDFEPEPIIVDEPPIAAEPPSFVEKMPEFIGGDVALMKFVRNKFIYPDFAKGNNIYGLTVVSFIVNEDGSISEIEIVRDPGGGCGKELKRIVSKMPNWLPGQQAGRKVKVKYTLPVRLELDGF